MPKKKLTERVVANAEHDPDGANTQWVWDTKLSGFGVRLNPGGSKSFVIKYRNAEKKQKIRTLGKCGHLKVKQARRKAREALGKIAVGEDPFDDEKPKTEIIMFAELADRYITEYAKVHKKSWERDQKRYQRRLEDRWGDRFVKSIEYNDVAQLHREIGRGEGHEVEANRTLALVQKMFNWGRSAGYVERSKVNPAADVQKFSEQSRRRTIQKMEMPRVLAAIDNEPKPFWRAAFYTLLLTGMRKSELKRCKWADVDLEHAQIHVREGKTDNARRTIPLSTPAVEILNGLERKPSNPYPGLFTIRANRSVLSWGERRKATGEKTVALDTRSEAQTSRKPGQNRSNHRERGA